MNAGNASSNNAANQTFYDSFKKNEEKAFKKAKDYQGTKKKKFVRNNQGMNNRMSYPLRDSPSERTGDRLMIRCLEFSPPEDGSGLNILISLIPETK